MKIRKLPVWAFIILESVLYISFLYTDITCHYTAGVWLKYASVTLCALFALFVSLRNLSAFVKSSRSNASQKADFSYKPGLCIFIAAALVFTLLADTFLLIFELNLPGLISFCAVQSLYLWVILSIASSVKSSKSEPLKSFFAAITIRVVLAFIIYITAAAPVMGKELLSTVTCFYAVSFLGNILRLTRAVYSVRTLRHASASIPTPVSCPRPALLLAGLILFALCDINVAFFNVSSYLDTSSPVLLFLIRASEYLMWAFYLPGQVLIALSCLKYDPEDSGTN